MAVIPRFLRHQFVPGRHSPLDDGAGGGWRRQEWDEEPFAEGDELAVDDDRDEELEIERKWLLLCRIDTEHFEYFYRKYRTKLKSFVLGRVGDSDTAEDLVAETFLEAVNGLWRFRFQGVTFGAWLFRLARRRIARYFERRERRGEVAFAGEDHDVSVPSTVQAGLEQDQDRQLLALAVRQLDPVGQDLVILHYWEHFTLAQIAVILGSTEPNTRARLYRARRKLASLLEAPEIRNRLSREGRRALDELRMDVGRMRLIEGGEESEDS